MAVDDLEKFEAASEADIGDRDVIAANEGLALEKELVERGERLANRPGRALLRLVLLRWRSVAARRCDRHPDLHREGRKAWRIDFTGRVGPRTAWVYLGPVRPDAVRDGVSHPAEIWA
jgi:hypothetical protein